MIGASSPSAQPIETSARSASSSVTTSIVTPPASIEAIIAARGTLTQCDTSRLAGTRRLSVANRPPRPVTSDQPILTATTRTAAISPSSASPISAERRAGRSARSMSMATNPPERSAVGAIRQADTA